MSLERKLAMAAVILFVIAEIVFVPLAIVWVVNLFFGTQYDYSFTNWAGITFILVVVRTLAYRGGR